MPDASTHPAAHNLHRWQLGLIASAASVIAVPYVLPMVGMGDGLMTETIANLCSNTTGGLAQAIEGLLSYVPVAGPMLAASGWGAALTSGGIGIAGVIAGDYIHRHYDRKGAVQWGRIIKYAALATSFLIALPSILSGISMGIAYLAYYFGENAGLTAARDVLAPTLGFSGVPHTSPTGLAGLLPHLLTCGRALLPIGAAALLANRSNGQSEASYSLKLLSNGPLFMGQPRELAFQLIDNETGRALTDAELETLHTKKLHTMIVDRSLTDYHHLHPVYDPARRLFTCQFTPRLQATYAMWNDFTVKGETERTHLKTKLSPIRSLASISARIIPENTITTDQLTAQILPQTPLRAGAGSMVTIELRDREGRPLTDLEPIMGAYAHLAGFSADGQRFIHCHPLGTEPTSNAERSSSPLRFHITPETAGMTKFFLQIKRDGQQITLPFGQRILPAEKFAERSATAHSHQHALGLG